MAAETKTLISLNRGKKKFVTKMKALECLAHQAGQWPVSFWLTLIQAGWILAQLMAYPTFLFPMNRGLET